MALLSLGWRLVPEVARHLKRGHARRPRWPQAPGTTHQQLLEEHDMTTVHPVVKRAVAFAAALVVIIAITQTALTRPAQAHHVNGQLLHWTTDR